MLYGVSEAGSDGWGDPIVLSTVIVGVIAIAAFVIQQLRSEKPMLDFRVFKYDIFSLSSVINIIITVALYTDDDGRQHDRISPAVAARFTDSVKQ